jgi:hypothetical protein
MAPQTKITDGKLAADVIFGPLPAEGPRCGVLGDSGCGKTHVMRLLVAEYVRRMPGCPVFIVDDKENKAQFVGQYRRDPQDMARKPPDKEPRIVVFRGSPFLVAQGEVDPEDVAEVQRNMAMRGRPSLVVYDELDKAANMMQWKKGDASTVRWAFIKGRSSGAATLWGTQETQAVPREAFNQSSCIIAFRMVGNPLRLLKERGYLEGGDVGGIISRLPGDELPPNKRGFFVLLRRGRPWDEKVYRFQ